MGQPQSSQIIYNVFTGQAKPGETPIFRNPLMVDKPLREINTFNVQTIWEALENVVNKEKKGSFFCCGSRVKTGKEQFAKEYKWKTFQEVYNMSVDFAKGCAVGGLTPEIQFNHDGTFKFLGIYSRNREEWIISDLASHCNSVTVVTIYDTGGDQAIEFIGTQTQLTTLVIEAKCVKKMLELTKAKRIGNLNNLIVLDEEDEPEVIKEFKEGGINIYSFQDILNKGKGQNVEFVHAKPETICTICYTSGTTGLPKGAKISHKAGGSEIDILKSVGFTGVDSDIYLSFLPLAHIMERLIVTGLIAHGIRIGFYSGSAVKGIEDATIGHPTAICAVPRIFQRIYEAIQDNISKLSTIQRALVQKGIKTKLDEYHKTGNLHNVFWDNLVFRKMRDILGGRIRFMLIGAAPMSPDVLDFIKIAFGSCIIEGYGQTEDCAGMGLTRIDDRVSGHLGGPGFANEVKLIDVPEGDYTSKDINPETKLPEPRGEICIRGPILFSGYLNDIENTKSAIDSDGWLHTGDVGVCLTNHGNAIRIIDRVKNIFKLSQGEYVAPEKLENILMKSQYIAQVFVYGDSFQNYLVGIIVPRPETCVKYLEEKGISCTKDDVFKHYNNEDGKSDIGKNLETLGKAHDFKGFEIIKKVYITNEVFSVDNDLCTPTLKIKRHNAKKRYLNEINAMYGKK